MRLKARNILISAITAAILIGAMWAYAVSLNVAPTAEAPEPAPDPYPIERAGDPEYTLAEVAGHADESDCWTVVDYNVYDITPFIPLHPGGREILRACGTDATDLFNGKDAHIMQDAHFTLELYFIGILK